MMHMSIHCSFSCTIKNQQTSKRSFELEMKNVENKRIIYSQVRLKCLFFYSLRLTSCDLDVMSILFIHRENLLHTWEFLLFFNFFKYVRNFLFSHIHCCSGRNLSHINYVVPSSHYSLTYVCKVNSWFSHIYFEFHS